MPSKHWLRCDYCDELVAWTGGVAYGDRCPECPKGLLFDAEPIPAAGIADGTK